MATALSTAAAERIFNARDLFTPADCGKPVKLTVRSISNMEFDTPLADEEGVMVKRRILNFQATNKAAITDEVKEAAKAGDYTTVLNKTELIGSILSSSSKYNQLYNGCEVNAIFTPVEGYDRIFNVKILSIVEPQRLGSKLSITDLLDS